MNNFNRIIGLKGNPQNVASPFLRATLRNIDTDFVLNLCYSDYGGSFLDRVLIEFFKQEYPENIIFETTSWNGQNAYVFGDISKKIYEDYQDDGELIEDFYSEKESDLIHKTATAFIQSNYPDKVKNSDLHELVYIWLSETGSPEPNYFDYSESKLLKYLQSNGYAANNTEN